MDRETGPRVVLTREPQDNAPLRQLLEEAGVPVAEIPCASTRFVTPPFLPPRVNGITFSSRRGVRGFFLLPEARKLLAGERTERPIIGSVGPSTTRALLALGYEPDLTADPPDGETLGSVLAARLQPNAEVAVVRGALSAGTLETTLDAHGISCHPVIVYENYSVDIEPLLPFDAFAAFVCAPSAAERLVAAAPWIKKRPFFAIGQTTAEAAQRLGIAHVIATGIEVTEQARAIIDLWKERRAQEVS